MSEEVADVLEQAADILETQGHCKGRYRDPVTDKFCLVGALGLASRKLTKPKNGSPIYVFNNDPNATYLLGAARVALAMELWGNPLREGDLARWNDMEHRKPEEVIDLLKNTAKELRNRSGDEVVRDSQGA